MAEPTRTQNRQGLYIKPTARAHKAENGSTQRRLKEHTKPVFGAPAGGFTCCRCLFQVLPLPASLAEPTRRQNHQGVRIKPTAPARKAENGSTQSRQKEHTKPVWRAPGGGFTCCCCLLQVLALPASLAEPARTQNRQGVRTKLPTRARKAENGSKQSRQTEHTKSVGSCRGL